MIRIRQMLEFPSSRFHKYWYCTQAFDFDSLRNLQYLHHDGDWHPTVSAEDGYFQTRQAVVDMLKPSDVEELVV